MPCDFAPGLSFPYPSNRLIRPHYPQLSADQVVADLNACNDKIEAVTGRRPTLVRLPYGDYDDNSINAVRSIGMEPIQWDVEASAT